MAAEAGHPANRTYRDQAGHIHLNGGQFLNDAEADVAPQLETVLGGVAAGYKVARGEVTLDGANPTPIVTGLATVVACTVSNKRSTAPGLDPHLFSVDYGGAVAAGTVNLYAWKPTGAADATMIASTDADDVISWVAVGT